MRRRTLILVFRFRCNSVTRYRDLALFAPSQRRKRWLSNGAEMAKVQYILRNEIGLELKLYFVVILDVLYRNL